MKKIFKYFVEIDNTKVREEQISNLKKIKKERNNKRIPLLWRR